MALVPLLVALSFAGLRIKDTLANAAEFSTLEQIADTSRTGSSLIQTLVDERDLAADPKAKKRPGLAGRSGRATTDTRAREFLKELSVVPEGTGFDVAVVSSDGLLPGQNCTAAAPESTLIGPLAGGLTALVQAASALNQSGQVERPILEMEHGILATVSVSDGAVLQGRCKVR
ncbi:hypothetical protein [Streptomyces noursei]|uniref:hypothetical protein n=1 Tax=Streptomyces noursei TaxID=1971 RepID=UPI0011AF0AA0|nr:hypothetical protein [Streptomyces noursei]